MKGSGRRLRGELMGVLALADTLLAVRLDEREHSSWVIGIGDLGRLFGLHSMRKAWEMKS